MINRFTSLAQRPENLQPWELPADLLATAVTAKEQQYATNKTLLDTVQEIQIPHITDPAYKADLDLAQQLYEALDQETEKLGVTYANDLGKATFALAKLEKKINQWFKPGGPAYALNERLTAYTEAQKNPSALPQDQWYNFYRKGEEPSPIGYDPATGVYSGNLSYENFESVDIQKELLEVGSKARQELVQGDYEPDKYGNMVSRTTGEYKRDEIRNILITELIAPTTKLGKSLAVETGYVFQGVLQDDASVIKVLQDKNATEADKIQALSSTSYLGGLFENLISDLNFLDDLVNLQGLNTTAVENLKTERTVKQALLDSLLSGTEEGLGLVVMDSVVNKYLEPVLEGLAATDETLSVHWAPSGGGFGLGSGVKKPRDFTKLHYMVVPSTVYHVDSKDLEELAKGNEELKTQITDKKSKLSKVTIPQERSRLEQEINLLYSQQITNSETVSAQFAVIKNHNPSEYKAWLADTYSKYQSQTKTWTREELQKNYIFQDDKDIDRLLQYANLSQDEFEALVIANPIALYESARAQEVAWGSDQMPRVVGTVFLPLIPGGEDMIEDLGNFLDRYDDEPLTGMRLNYLAEGFEGEKGHITHLEEEIANNIFSNPSNYSLMGKETIAGVFGLTNTEWQKQVKDVEVHVLDQAAAGLAQLQVTLKIDQGPATEEKYETRIVTLGGNNEVLMRSITDAFTLSFGQIIPDPQQVKEFYNLQTVPDILQAVELANPESKSPFLHMLQFQGSVLAANSPLEQQLYTLEGTREVEILSPGAGAAVIAPDIPGQNTTTAALQKKVAQARADGKIVLELADGSYRATTPSIKEFSLPSFGYTSINGTTSPVKFRVRAVTTTDPSSSPLNHKYYYLDIQSGYRQWTPIKNVYTNDEVFVDRGSIYTVLGYLYTQSSYNARYAQ